MTVPQASQAFEFGSQTETIDVRRVFASGDVRFRKQSARQPPARKRFGAFRVSYVSLGQVHFCQSTEWTGDDAGLLARYERERVRGPGGANNLQGLGGRSGKVADPKIVNVDNIHFDKEKRPSGTSASAGLRKLMKAAAGATKTPRHSSP